ncbi:MAG: TonB-dependent receptor [Acidobacteria bacterium]|nr:TonB-dependent receptor [Acidobacteriota bacterium]
MVSRFLAKLVANLFCVILVPTLVFAIQDSNLKGKIVDPSGNPITEANVVLLTAKGTQIAQASPNSEGVFELASISTGNYVLQIDAKGWSMQRLAVNVADGVENSINVEVSVSPVEDQVTITASAGEALEIFEYPRAISVASAEEIRRRPAVGLPQALREEPGIHVQQTTASQGSVFMRGLTGQRVVALVDGIRYNNTTFRPGPTQYLATVPIQSAGSVELVRGPASVQYGSDGLGGTINVIAESPFFTPQATEIHGQFGLQFGSADVSGGSNFKLGIGNSKFNLTTAGFFTRVNDLRPGDGIDSHAAVTRFLGISSKVLGDRLQDTGFTQYGGEARLALKPTPDQQITFTYLRNDLQNTRRYDQLNGGNGNLIQGFDPQTFDFFYARYQKQQVGFFDSLTGTFSFNRQRDDRQSQGGNGDQRGTITTEFNKTDAFGYSLLASTHVGKNNILLVGADFYDEYVDSTSFTTSPVTGRSSVARGRFPNDARYKTFGFYAEDTFDILPRKLRLIGGVRYGATQFKTRAKDDPIINGRPVGLDASTRQDDVTFNVGVSVNPRPWLSLYTNINRGFRTPNVNDLGGVGITSNGFTVTANQAAEVGAEVGNSAGATARTTGAKLSSLDPESIMNYEGGFKVKTDRVEASFGGFVADLEDVTVIRALVVPGNAVGRTIAGQTIVSQSSTGVIFVAGSSQPVIARVNGGEVRFSGIEASTRVKLNSDFSVQANGFYLKSRDKNPPLQSAPPAGVILIRKATDAPDFEGGLPPSGGFLSVKYQPAGKRYWAEVYSTMAGKQDRLSSTDLNDQRQGATRSRANIATFFNNGARARGLVGAGADGRMGTADDILIATGETLTQVQDRVLGGRNIMSAPFFLSTPGYATLNFRGGIKVGENSEFVFILENVLDKNYRIHGSGTDNPGINFATRYQFRF